MQNYELDAYLGDIETIPEQRDLIRAAAEQIDQRYHIPADGTPEDVADDRETALTAAMQVILGDTQPDEAVDAWKRAQAAMVEAHAAMTGALIAAMPDMTERAAEQRFGLTRPTIRKALGKKG